MPARRRGKRRRTDQTTPRQSGGRSAAQRLEEALAALTGRASGNDSHQSVTAAELCRIAGVSRNSLYRYHTSVLQALQQYQQEHPLVKPTARSRPEPLGIENAALRDQLAKLATLVDHYYGAYRETYVFLQRRERELAGLRRSLDRKPLALAR